MAKVRLFSTPTCPYCVTLKEYLKKNKIAFEEIDVSQNQIALNEMVEKTEQTAVPVIDIDGQFIIGFDKEKISQLLNLKD